MRQNEFCFQTIDALLGFSSNSSPFLLKFTIKTPNLLKYLLAGYQKDTGLDSVFTTRTIFLLANRASTLEKLIAQLKSCCANLKPKYEEI